MEQTKFILQGSELRAGDCLSVQGFAPPVEICGVGPLTPLASHGPEEAIMGRSMMPNLASRIASRLATRSQLHASTIGLLHACCRDRTTKKGIGRMQRVRIRVANRGVQRDDNNYPAL